MKSTRAGNNMSRFSFGATSAITTSIALIAGLDETLGARSTIVGALLVIALADNVADSLGIHIFSESQCSSPEWKSRVDTLTNFFTRLAITLVFVGLIVFLPLSLAVPVSICFGLVVLAGLSYLIARAQKANPAV